MSKATNNAPYRESTQSQEKRFFEFCSKVTTTATHITELTGIVQKNITRFKRKYEKQEKLKEVNLVKCPVTGKWAWTITTDPKKFPPNNQLKINFRND